ncbi:MAG: MBOAT family O-acyltransferase [Bacteroidales bacterium]|jgi:D-alanyl-lipoteichoic acid acyltransferase DltB (MBOAT superfamily)
MLFTSLNYLLFIALVVIAYYLSPLKLRWIILLVASYVFICFANASSLFVIIFSTVFNYFFGLFISRNENSPPLRDRGNANFQIFNVSIRKSLFLLGLIINIASLFIIKYLVSFATITITISAPVTYRMADLIFLLGFSFYTLQNIAYLTDVYYENIEPEKNIFRYAFYTAFFAKVASGPIETARNFIPQIFIEKKFDYENFTNGFQRIIIGLFKKIVIADRLAPAVSSIFDLPAHNCGLTTLVGVYLFTIQLYLDFSGYADMAIGTAQLFGYKLSENFILPFDATSISEFWRRWHITLINWLKNYIYFPVVYKLRKYKKTGTIIGIIIIFIISGIWHGLGLTFLIWSIIHCICMIYETLTKNYRKKLSGKINFLSYKILSVFITLNIVAFANIFFRAKSVGAGLKIIGEIFNITNFIPKNYLFQFVNPLAIGGHLEVIFNFYMLILLIIFYFIFENKLQKIISQQKNNYFLIFLFLMLILLFGVFNENAYFIYNKF